MTAQASPSQAEYALSVALEWAGHGFAVFPIEVYPQADGSLNKVPRNAHGHLGATDEPEALATMFAGLTPNQSTGAIAVGMLPSSGGIVVVDVDIKNGKDGLASFSKLGVANTCSVRTPSGGFHVWFRTHMVFGNKSPWPGIDIRGGRGWVVAPGMYAPWAHWEFVGSVDAIPELPPHIEEALLAHRSDDPTGTGDVRCLTGGNPCRRMNEAIAAVHALSWAKDSRHDSMVKAQGAIVKLGDQGHTGAIEALRILREAFDAAKPKQSPGEWTRALSGAIEKFGGSTVDPFCDCGRLADDPMFAGAETEPVSGRVVDAAPRRLFVGATLQVAAAAEELMDRVPVAIDDIHGGGHLWVYMEQGYWRRITTDKELGVIIAPMLGQRYRDGHVASIETMVRTRAEQFDPLAIDQRFINVSNGMLEWEADRLHSHSPEFHSINQLAAEYDPAATCPTIDAWLADVLHPDLLEPNSEGRVPIDEVLGYLVVSGNPFHKAILLLGSGRNGKGTFIRLVEAMLGAHNVSSVTLSDLVNNRFRGADLYGKLANIAGDIDAGWLESTAMFKAVTGGDLISAEIKFGQPFTFTPTAVPLFSANGVFRTPDTSDGYLARWLVIEFPNSFVGREDRSLDMRLQAETSGLLNRAVNGLRTLLPAGNFAMVESILASRRAFERANDPVRAFIEDCTVKDPTGFVSRQDISRLYNGWMEEEGGNPLSREKLYERLKTAGLREGRTRTDGRGFHGIRLTHRVGMLGMLEPLATVDELD